MQTSVQIYNLTLDKSNDKYMLLLFLLWPFMAFVLAWKDFMKPLNQRVILGFFMLYGFTYVIHPTMDGQQYANKFMDAYNRPFSDFFEIIEGLYESSLDFIQPLITFSISRFTDYPGFLFLAFALVFGIFYLKSLREVILIYQTNPNINTLIFTVLFAFTNSIFQINGFRMWTAAWVFFLGVYMILIYNDHRYYFLAFSSIIVHFSFLPLVILLVIYKLLGNRIHYYFWAAIATLFIAELDVTAVRNYASYLGPAFEQKISAYTNEAYMISIEEAKQEYVWFMKYTSPAVLYFLVIQLSIIYYNYYSLIKSKLFENLFSFSLILLAFCNIMSLLPSGDRYRTVFYLFCAATLVAYYSYYSYRKNSIALNIIGAVPISLYILINFRVGLSSMSTAALFPSFLFPFSYGMNWPIDSWLF